MNRVEKVVRMARDIGRELRPEALVLDFGCGAGNQVQKFLELGLDCHGCDLEFKPGPHADTLQAAGRLRKIQWDPYRLPFEDRQFDFVLSDQVFEHVQNYPETLAELRRVLRPDGWSLHIFPARWRVFEPHIGTPFGCVIRSEAWVTMWARLGFNRRHPELSGDWRQVAAKDWEYLRTCTNYLSLAEIHRHFRAAGFRVQHLERQALRYSGHRWLSAMRSVPGVAQICHNFGAHVIAAW
jgi:SAM-dependent methyltransferase